MNPYGSSPLIDATTNGLTDVLKLLLEAGAYPNICDDVSIFLLSLLLFCLQVQLPG
jgi:ankyrin repeat protein